MELQNLEIQVNQTDTLIPGAENRLGAHSVEPILIQEIFDILEDQDALLNRIRQLQEKIEEKVS